MEDKRSFAERRSALISVIRERSYREGNFQLASGKESAYYFDLKETTLNQEGMTLIGSLAFDLIEEKGLDPYAVGGMTLGADPVSVAIAYAAAQRGKRLESFIVRKEPKGHGTEQWIEGAKSFPAGSKVLMIEDVVTTGGSGIKSVKIAKNAGYEVLGLFTVVDRLEGGAEACKEEGIPLFSLCTLDDFRSKN